MVCILHLGLRTKGGKSMTLRTMLAATALTLLVTTMAAPRADAETYVTGYGGIVFGGDLASGPADDFDTSNRHGVYGGALGFIGSPLGFEVDFSYSPDFFGSNRSLVPNNNLVTLMGNVVLSGHMGERSRIYASAGAGLLKSSVDDADDFFDVSRNDFGASVGVGVLAGVGEKLSIRADVRYFRNLGDEEPDADLDIDFGSFDFWRATAGLSLRF
jgi:opacity protein-like surface antigen